MSNENEIENENEDVENATEDIIVCDLPNPDPTNEGLVQVIAMKEGKTAKIFYDFGHDLETMTAMFGQEVVHNFARGQMIIRLRATMCSRLVTGGDVEGLVDEFKPGIAMPKTPKDMKKATETYFMGLSAEEQNAMISKLMEKKG